MQLNRGIVCEEIAGYPRHLRGYNGFLANLYYFSRPQTRRVWQLFRVRSVVDVGAAIGGWSIAAMRAWGWDIEVHAFEPNPVTLRDIKWNIGDLPNVHIWPYAAMNETRRAALCQPTFGTGDLANVGQLSLVQEGEPRFIVDAVKIDDILPDFNPDFMKIDVEGAEPNALLGAEKMLRRSKPVLFIETTRTLIPVRDILHSFGYRSMYKTGSDHLFWHPDNPRTSRGAWAALGQEQM